MVFENTVSIGDVLAIALAVIAFISAFLSLKFDLKSVKKDLQALGHRLGLLENKVDAGFKEVRREAQDFRDETHTEFKKVRNEMYAGFKEVQREAQDFRDEMHTEFRRMDEKLGQKDIKIAVLEDRTARLYRDEPFAVPAT